MGAGQGAAQEEFCARPFLLRAVLTATSRGTRYSGERCRRSPTPPSASSPSTSSSISPAGAVRRLSRRVERASAHSLPLAGAPILNSSRTAVVGMLCGGDDDARCAFARDYADARQVDQHHPAAPHARVGQLGPRQQARDSAAQVTHTCACLALPREVFLLHRLAPHRGAALLTPRR